MMNQQVDQQRKRKRKINEFVHVEISLSNLSFLSFFSRLFYVLLLFVFTYKFSLFDEKQKPMKLTEIS